MLLELLKIAYGALLISVYCFWRYAVIPPLVTWAVGPETWRHAVVVYGFVLWLVVKTWASETRSIEYVREGEEAFSNRFGSSRGSGWAPVARGRLADLPAADEYDSAGRARGHWKAGRKANTAK